MPRYDIRGRRLFEVDLLDTATRWHICGYMRTTLDLPDSILREAKAAAAHRGISLKRYFAEALETYQGQVCRNSAIARPQRVSLPLIRHSGDSRVAMTNEQIEEALAVGECVTPGKS